MSHQLRKDRIVRRRSADLLVKSLIARRLTIDSAQVGLQNAKLLDAAQADAFAAIATADTNLRYQQSVSSRRIAIVVLSGRVPPAQSPADWRTSAWAETGGLL